MDKIIVQGVRSFADRQEIPLRRLTVLVGENSSGKSTFLALSRIAWDISHGQPEVDFNEEPFPLGAYEQLASWFRGRAGRAKSLTIGTEFIVNPIGRPRKSIVVLPRVKIEGTFVKRGSQPKLEKLQLEWGANMLSAKYDSVDAAVTAEFTTPNGKYVADPHAFHHRFIGGHLDLWSIFRLPIWPFEDELIDSTSAAKSPTKADFRQLDLILRDLRLDRSLRPYAFAPIRTQPQRTYDPLKEIPKPEGSHVPMILARLSASEPDSWLDLRNAIDDFGRQSGLFTEVDIRRMGKTEGDPFQIVVKVTGPAFNLVDIGYGVSQILPVIVDILRGGRERIFLLQQPEVHLHPKAQAELGTFLATVAKTQKKRFVVETHSDYLVDRIRMDIRDRKILKAEDVIILYFERMGGKTTIHPIEIDEFGNLKNVPKGYRSFFLEEERRFLEGER